MLTKILTLLNIHPDSNQKWILGSMCVSCLVLTYVSPTLVKEIYSSLPAQWIAFQALFGSIVGFIIGMIWKGKIRESVIKYFIIFCITESICGCLLAYYLCFIQYNVWIYAIVSLIYTNIVCQFVGKCVMYFRTRLWNERAREVYENNISVADGICSIIGFLFALLLLPSLKLSLFLWGTCCIIDDLGWIIVYIKNKEKLKIIEENG